MSAFKCTLIYIINFLKQSKMEKETAYKVEHNDTFCIVFLLSDALYLINEGIENNYEKKDKDSFEFKLSVIEMTEEEIKNLGEFEGFD